MTEIISIKEIVDADTGLHIMHTEVLEGGKTRVIVEIIDRPVGWSQCLKEF